MIKYPYIYNDILRFLPKQSGVYAIFNSRTKKYYVGFAAGKQGIYGRIRRHFEVLRNGCHDNRLMRADWNDLENSETDWHVFILNYTNNKEDEVYWTLYLQSHIYGYNLKIGDKHTELSKQWIRDHHAGGAKPGHKHSDETCIKIGKANSGSKRHPDWDNGTRKMIKRSEIYENNTRSN